MLLDRWVPMTLGCMRQECLLQPRPKLASWTVCWAGMAPDCELCTAVLFVGNGIIVEDILLVVCWLSAAGHTPELQHGCCSQGGFSCCSLCCDSHPPDMPQLAAAQALEERL